MFNNKRIKKLAERIDKLEGENMYLKGRVLNYGLEISILRDRLKQLPECFKGIHKYGKELVINTDNIRWAHVCEVCNHVVKLVEEKEKV